MSKIHNEIEPFVSRFVSLLSFKCLQVFLYARLKLNVYDGYFIYLPSDCLVTGSVMIVSRYANTHTYIIQLVPIPSVSILLHQYPLVRRMCVYTKKSFHIFGKGECVCTRVCEMSVAMMSNYFHKNVHSISIRNCLTKFSFHFCNLLRLDALPQCIMYVVTINKP